MDPPPVVADPSEPSLPDPPASPTTPGDGVSAPTPVPAYFDYGGGGGGYGQPTSGEDGPSSPSYFDYGGRGGGGAAPAAAPSTPWPTYYNWQVRPSPIYLPLVSLSIALALFVTPSRSPPRLLAPI